MRLLLAILLAWLSAGLSVLASEVVLRTVPAGTFTNLLRNGAFAQTNGTVYWNDSIKAQLYGNTPPAGLDGEYLDSLEGYVTAELNLRRDHFRWTTVPLTFPKKCQALMDRNKPACTTTLAVPQQWAFRAANRRVSNHSPGTGWRKREQGRVTMCHETRMGGYTGSH